MSKFSLFIFAIFTLITSGCTVKSFTTADGKKTDSRLVGTWTGSEKDQQIEGISKSWVVNRMQDGTYTMDFTFTQDGKENRTTEEGKWWTEGNKFYEFHDYDDKTDTYSFSVLDESHVKFKVDKMSVSLENPDYEFIDTKVPGSAISKELDGSSYEKAVKIKDVSAEYRFIKENCSDCQKKEQAMGAKDGKNYDVLTVTKPDGSEKTYYFDITSFFGKGF